jgi:hypothetical protein
MRSRKLILSKLAQIDLEFRKAIPFPKSLNPELDEPRTLCEIFCILYSGKESDIIWDEFLSVTEQIIRSQFVYYPQNIFWDFDYLLFYIWSQKNKDVLFAMAKKILNVQLYYSSINSINFAYIHDFIYGYDWDRWVRKDIKNRYLVGLYDLKFLSYLEKRGLQIIDSIGSDERYPVLVKNQNRNVYNFHRHGAAEIKTLTSLAKEENIPIQGWRTDGGEWDCAKNYMLLREKKANELI